ncbi:acyl-CoA carboxylase subunit epsilon [Plantactinospora sp. KLBMP9567]|uniref:acyl-CoA carboxylase subunit epsilon n=1 Tax=Plantactinospora sp. KLBMP9567 TaxID=3085900 RepID=UPI002982678C|nr:acyl-CoA carboxylase subunit epsilon [Plantactinospora sp. KLBMP9567]MDW5326350.1 acyl-CoA carboxylase subunit epsilon [Plantactinospora sp. KLBMP9567]
MADEEPLLRVVRGTPTPEELAALVGAVLLRSRPATSAPAVAASTWARRGRPGTASPPGGPAHTGRDAWRLSGLPY